MKFTFVLSSRRDKVSQENNNNVFCPLNDHFKYLCYEREREKEREREIERKRERENKIECKMCFLFECPCVWV